VGKQRRSGYILLGQFEQLGTRTEIVVRLLRVRDGHPVWSGTYWRDPDGMTAFPLELAQDVTEALRLQSSSGR
jgi:TolB-like protein